MTIKHRLVQALAAQVLLTTLAHAEPSWYAIWAVKPTDTASTTKVEDMLTADADRLEGKDPLVRAIKANFLDNGKTSALWYWFTKIEPNKLKDKKYQDLVGTDVS